VATCPKKTNDGVYKGWSQQGKEGEHDNGQDETADRAWSRTVSDKTIVVVAVKKQLTLFIVQEQEESNL
jgi:hypothetical protein